MAVLETLVHLDIAHVGPRVAIPADLPDDPAMERLDPAALPPDGFITPGPPALRDIGSAWVEAQRTVALHLPSAIVHDEFNCLLNPLHPDFGRGVSVIPAISGSMGGCGAERAALWPLSSRTDSPRL